MDLRLPLLADANLHLGVAEEAAASDSWLTAEQELDKAEEALEQLRQQWPEINESDKGLLSQMVSPLKNRADQLRSALPPVKAVSEGAPVVDPEQEEDPEG